MFKCVTCGEVFDTPETKSSYLCECGESSVYEGYGVCPNCQSDEFEEAQKCEVCGEYMLEDEIFGDVCEGCIQQYENDIQGCYELSQNEAEEISINAFLCTMFTTQEIEELLLRELKNANASCKKFIESDKTRFGELLLEKEKKNEIK